jgi:hypothetical protein
MKAAADGGRSTAQGEENKKYLKQAIETPGIFQ